MPKDTEAVLDMDVNDILEEFALLPDPRSHINRPNLLGDLVVITIIDAQQWQRSQVAA